MSKLKNMSILETISTIKNVIYLITISLINIFGRFFLSWKRINHVHDKAVLITGCDTGFGHLIALDMNRTGFTVFAGCLFPDKDAAKSLYQKCPFKDKMVIVPMDVSSVSSIKEAKKLIIERLNGDNLKLWALINNAGIARVTEFEWGSFDEEIRKVFDVNVFGVCHVTRAFLPLIRRAKGRILNMNSVCSKFSAPGIISYNMTKHATLAMTTGLRRELFKFGIKVISIEPVCYRTNIVDGNKIKDMTRKSWTETKPEIRKIYGNEYFNRFLNVNSVTDFLGRDPEEVARDVNHAVTAVYPKMSYAVSGYAERLFLWYLNCINHPEEGEEILWNLFSMHLKLDTTFPDE